MRDLVAAEKLKLEDPADILRTLEPFDIAVLEFAQESGDRNVGFLGDDKYCYLTKDFLNWAIILDFVRMCAPIRRKEVIQKYFSYFLEQANSDSDEPRGQRVSRAARFPTSIPTLGNRDSLKFISGYEVDRQSEAGFSYQFRQARISQLELHGYIVDPTIWRTAITAVVLGLLPQSYTVRTEHGEVVHQKVTAMLYDWEQNISGPDREIVQHHINMSISITAFKELLRAWIEENDEPSKPDN
ncbi:hypothetical protein [Hoeflea poritis]|uniref:Uncharacterized protein n=1 Tax=Hoeflea poritis TaxID=2993659 RepID=A0ABT4VPU8_9HYPH|nr:hypothetical protein [Hoeflea poritis]MDA4846737.1 hypothetical protein [Hoeflea poritis]